MTALCTCGLGIGRLCACETPTPWLVAHCHVCGWSGPPSEARGVEGHPLDHACPRCRTTPLRAEPASAAERTLPLPFPEVT